MSFIKFKLKSALFIPREGRICKSYVGVEVRTAGITVAGLGLGEVRMDRHAIRQPTATAIVYSLTNQDLQFAPLNTMTNPN